MKLLLALFCLVCPLCVYARLKPQSAFACKLREMEKDCPACKAYNTIFRKKKKQ